MEDDSLHGDGTGQLTDSQRKVFEIMRQYTQMAFGLIKSCQKPEELSPEDKQAILRQLPEIVKFKNENNFGAIRMTIDLSWLRNTCLNIVASVPEENKNEAAEFCKEVFDYDPINHKIRLIMSLPEQD